MRRIAIAGGVLALIGAIAWVVADKTGPASDRAPSAVDIGFAQDMLVHHQQAVVMAAYTREHARSDGVRSLAGSIDSAQQREIGQMTGWLQSWGEPLQADRLPMAWMDSDTSGREAQHDHDAGSMPGMATPAELDELVNLTGKRLDAQFLKLMIRHHEGGLPMAKAAALRARTTYVRDAARLMIQDQQREIDQMQVLLQPVPQRG